MASFVALYRGETVASARLMGVTTDANIVASVASALISQSHELEDRGDPVVMRWESARRTTLATVREEVAP